MRLIFNGCFYISLLFFAVTFTSCNRGNAGDNEIKAGDDNKMIIISYDTILTGDYNSPKNFVLDINNDGINDIGFTSELWGSPAVGMNPRTYILCLNNDIELYGYHKQDTSFLTRDTRTFEGSGNAVFVYDYYIYSCSGNAAEDSILNVTLAFKIQPLEKYDVISSDDTFLSDTVKLTDNAYSFPPTLTGESGDTTFFEYKIFKNDCFSFPADEVKYIGVRSVKENKLGWIKLSIFDKYKILIMESGFQK